MHILDGRSQFFQWDKNIKVTCDNLKEGDKVHFENGTTEKALVTKAYSLDGKIVADVPNIFLTMSFPLKIYRYIEDKECLYTLALSVFEVIHRPMPEDYIYEQTEVLTVEKTVNDALQKAKESGEFDGKDGVDGKDGKDGVNGKDGKDGADGLSAYQIAVNNGFEGTEEEWLKSHAPLVDGKVPMKNIPNNAFDIIRGYFYTDDVFIPEGEHNEELEEFGHVVPRQGVFYFDMGQQSGLNPLGGAVCIWRGNGFERIATVGEFEAALQSLKQSVDLKIEDVEQDVDALDGKIGDISTALDELHAYAQNLVNGGSAE